MTIVPIKTPPSVSMRTTPITPRRRARAGPHDTVAHHRPAHPASPTNQATGQEATDGDSA